MNEVLRTPSIRIIDNDEGFLKLKDCWNDLLENSNADTVFLTWEWVWEWWQHFKESKKLVILVAEEAGQVIGIAPFYTQKVNFFGLHAYTHLELCASTGASSAYLDLILMKGRERELVRRFIDELVDNQNIRWDVFNLIFIRKESENLRWCLEYWAEKKKKVNIYDEWPSYYIDMSVIKDDWSKVIGRKMRANCRNYLNKISAQYKTYLEIITTPENHENNLADFVRLHQVRQEVKNEKGSFNAQRRHFVAFHSAISRILLEKGWCQFVFLNVNGERIAGQYNFAYKGKVSGFSCGFDPAWSNFSVGNILIYMALEQDIKNNYREFDFLRGSFGNGNDEYKSRWTENMHISVNAAFWRSNFVYTIMSFEKKVRIFIKRFLSKELAMKIYRNLFSRKD